MTPKLDISIAKFILAIVCLTSLLFGTAAQAEPLVIKFLDEVSVSDIIPGATAYGQLRPDLPVVEALKDGKVVGYVFLTSDFVTTTGYSGKPIHTLMGVDDTAKLTGVRLVKHSEPIVLVGIPESKITAVTEKYAGLDLIAEAAAGGSAHDLDIVSGATVTIIVIDDSIVRAGLKVARALGLGGLEPELASSGPSKVLLMPDDVTISDWQTLAGDGSIRSLRLDVGQVNAAFEETGDTRGVKRPEKDAPEDTFIDMHIGLVSAPEIGTSLLGKDEYANLRQWLGEGDQAILVFTLVGLGWYANAHLSVANVLAFFSATMAGFSWSAFLMDPLVFILWFSVAASLLFWGRGVYCGWLCPFGAALAIRFRLSNRRLPRKTCRP